MLPLNPTTDAALDEQTTAPYFLVMLGFDSPVRFCSMDEVSWDGHTWINAEFDIRLDGQAQFEIFNEGYQLGQVVLTEGTAGRSIEIYQGYANDTAHPNPEMIFEGEMGKAKITDQVVIDLKPSPPLRTPRHFFVPPTFNHLPPAGTRFETPNGVVILER